MSSLAVLQLQPGRPVEANREPTQGEVDAGSLGLLAPLAQGRDVVVNGSRAALAEAKAAFPALTVLHITAPLDVLADRLAARGRETRADIAARLARAAQSLPEGLPVLEVLNDATPETGITRLLQALRG